MCRIVSKRFIFVFIVVIPVFAVLGARKPRCVQTRSLCSATDSRCDHGTSTTAQERPGLRFTPQGTFKIMQLTDMHLGEAHETDWGPQQDVKTYNLLSSLIPFENPDLILLTGDQLTGNDCDENATAYYQQIGEFLEQFNIPWALTFGNHDDADFSRNLNGSEIEAKTKRPELAQALEKFPLSLTETGPSDVTGTSNFVLPIHDGCDDVVSQIVLLDSGGGSIPVRFHTSQVDWVREKLNDTPMPTLIFQHIPTIEFNFDEDRCVGTQKDGVAYVNPDAGMFSFMKSNDNILLLAAGHNHGNDYCCRVEDASLHLCFGRHSGYGGYTAVDRGARVYQLQLRGSTRSRNLRTLEDDSAIAWTSWVRLESGEIIDEYTPFKSSIASLIS